MVFRAPTIDPAITLFGTRISVLETQPDEDDHLPAKPACSDDVQTCAETKVCQEKADPALVPGLDHHDELIREGPTSTIVDDVAVLVPNDNEGDKNRECSSNDNSTTCPDPDTSSQQKVLKKPDKILPCPRCNSLETKFCYYNNYNVNQPRYYCKKCERYWTDGGTMRNVPVGAGRRKNKHSANHCRNPCASEGMPHPGINVSVPLPGHMQPSCNPQHESGNMMVLKFRPKEPHHQIEEDPLNVGERSKVIQSCSTTSESQGNSSAPVTVTDHTTRNRPPDDIPEVVQNAGTAYAKVASVHPMQYYPGNNWAFLRSPGWNSAAFAAVGCASDTICGPENGGPNVLPWSPTSFVSAPAYVSPTIPLPLVPAAFWGCMTSWPTGAWNAPLVGYHGSLSPSAPSSLASQPTNKCSGNQSFKLGKRLRDGASQVEDKAAASLWFPKTLRIDDPDQAAKSSIWATLGIKHDPSKPITKGTLFKCFQTETKGKIQQSDANEVLDANPAALSRSLAFQEGS